MAKSTVVVTDTWQQVATGAVVITVDVQGSSALLFNESATDVNALSSRPDAEEQFAQNEALATFVRSDGDGWEIQVDGAL